MEKLVSFLVPSEVDLKLERIPSWLDIKIHQSTGGFPHWEDWTRQQKKQFEEVAGPIMQILGYD